MVILDVTLPDGNGFELFEEIKARKELPVIFLTALDGEEEIVKGFELGADEYITKPFRPRELLSRIRNVIRHTGILEENRGQILSGIWDESGNFVNNNTLTVYIKRLREKIEEDQNAPKIIKTVRGMGYKAGV